MIKLHHLNRSRSKRIIWLLEEIKQPYEVVSYQRNASNSLAPESLKEVHRLGKSPVVEIDGLVLPESGAITEYLIERYAPDTLAPAKNSDDYAKYLYWIHFAESSAILPSLIKVYSHGHKVEHESLARYVDQEESNLLEHIEQELAGKTYLVSDKLTGADIMMIFAVELLSLSGKLTNYPYIAAYYQNIGQLPGFQKAQQLEAQYDETVA
ncbi:MAG: glutathione S-transferase [Reinekea sp.]